MRATKYAQSRSRTIGSDGNRKKEGNGQFGIAKVEIESNADNEWFD